MRDDRGVVRVIPRRDAEPLTGSWYFYGHRDDVAKLYPVPGEPVREAAGDDDAMTPPTRKTGRPLKHDWHSIDGEIAARCIDPKPKRLDIPASERDLAKGMLQWCSDTYEREPAMSEMREAVKRVCARLRQR